MIVGLVGSKGCGKSTVANLMVQNNGFQVVKFAGALKDMLRALGLSEEEIEGDLKETPSDLLCGKTPRHAMQTLGTEWGRDMIGPNFWVQAWAARAQQHRLVVCDDCRFENEAATIAGNNGRLIRIIRPSADGHGDTHASEALANELPVHAEVINDGTIDQLYQRVYAEVWS